MEVIAAYGTLSNPFRNYYPDLRIWKNEKEADLVIFTGGEDISPGNYNEKSDGTYGINPERDEREVDLLNRIIYGDFITKRILGVCRGHQLMSAVFGLRLIQDIYSLGVSHKAYHEILWTVPNIFDSFVMVNSMHHQAVSEGSYKLFQNKIFPTILAKDTHDGLIEAVLWGESYLGVQFHPEFMSPKDGGLFFDTLNTWVKGGKFFTDKRKKSSPRPEKPAIMDGSEFVARFIRTDERAERGRERPGTVGVAFSGSEPIPMRIDFGGNIVTTTNSINSAFTNDEIRMVTEEFNDNTETEA
jgi:putative glutamine amidotransferase